jgi:hypothetical protein
MGDSNYLAYSDSIEQIQPDEAEVTELIVASMGRVNQKIFDKHRHALRDAHAKSHGVLKGELEVYPDLPQHLRQGIFAMPKRYAVIAPFDRTRRFAERPYSSLIRHGYQGTWSHWKESSLRR